LTWLFKKTLAEKLKKITNEEVKKKKEKENKEAIQRTRRMVISNLISSLLLKVPLALNPIFEITNTYLILSRGDNLYNHSVHIIEVFNQNPVLDKLKEKNYKSNFLYFCLELNGCEMFYKLSNVCLFLSFTFTFIFYYKFDKNFKICFKRFIFKNEPPPPKKPH
jgi:hypothetical protein